jgi:hypothetical protein
MSSEVMTCQMDLQWNFAAIKPHGKLSQTALIR